LKYSYRDRNEIQNDSLRYKKRIKIYINTDLKIILSDHQNNYVGNLCTQAQ